MSNKRGFFYGWILIPVAWVLYGFGISPAYYSGGQFAPSLMEDLELSRAQWGLIFGIFTFAFSAVAPFTAYLMSRFSIRATMTLGATLCSIGFFWMSRADSMMDCVVGFGLLGGIGIGLSTILPSQTLGQNWFLKYRARAIAVILTAGGVVGATVPYVDRWILENRSWSDGWLYISGISAVLAVLAAVFVRDRPEDIDQFRDGGDSDPSTVSVDGAAAGSVGAEWTASQAIRTKQFALMILCGLAYSQPWGIIVAHGKLHMDQIGMDPDVIPGMFALMITVSILGRLCASAGDLIAPKTVLAIALVLEAIGVGGLLFAKTPLLAYASVTVLGIGYGMGYAGISVVFTDFFGRQAFAGSAAVRILIGGCVGLFVPALAGWVADNTSSYNGAFLALTVLCLIGAVVSYFCPRPGAPPEVDEARA